MKAMCHSCIYLSLNCELVLRRSSSLGLCRTCLLLLCIKTSFMLMVNYGNIGEKLPHRSVHDMFDFVKYDIDNERAEFTRSLAWRGRYP